MKISSFFFSIVIAAQVSVAQPPDYFVDNWYLHSFSFLDGEVFINTLGVSQGPTMLIKNDFTLYGSGFCNNYSGNFEYTSHAPLGVDDTFRPRNIVRETNNCGALQEMETHFFLPFMQEKVADIFIVNPSSNEKHIVLQYNFGYQVYKNFPALRISDLSLNEIIIYPNPVENKIFINFGNNAFERISITDLNGRVVLDLLENPPAEIEVSNLKSGMYFIRIETLSGNIVKKFIKD